MAGSLDRPRTSTWQTIERHRSPLLPRGKTTALSLASNGSIFFMHPRARGQLLPRNASLLHRPSDSLAVDAC